MWSRSSALCWGLGFKSLALPAPEFVTVICSFGLGFVGFRYHHTCLAIACEAFDLVWIVGLGTQAFGIKGPVA